MWKQNQIYIQHVASLIINSLLILIQYLCKQIFGGLHPYQDNHLFLMELIFQNSKQLKQVRQFIKGLGYVYDSIDQKEKQVYLYISGSYIAVINNFINTNVPNYKICFCKLRRNMYKLKNFFNGNQQLENQGIIFYLDVDLILKLLNTQLQSQLTQMVMVFPELQTTGEDQYEMKLRYECDQLKGSFKVFTRLEHSSWPFKQGNITQQCISNSFMTKFITFPSKFVKQIEQYKKHPQFWICLGSDGINIKRTEGNYVILDHVIKKQQIGDYDFYSLNQVLKGNINLSINSDAFFHHLEQSNRQNRKAITRLLIEQLYHEEQNMMKKCYLCLTTTTQKRQIQQFFQVSARPAIDYSGIVREVQRLKLRTRDAKKQEEADDERVVLNKFYGPQYEQTVRMDMIMRLGFVRQPEPKQQTVSNPRKYKVQL